MPLRWQLDAIELLAGIVIFLAVWAVRYWKMGSNQEVNGIVPFSEGVKSVDGCLFDK
ncbi:MAG: hypothetical protein ABSB39_16385 [Candidatus Sulfotelmatobacter sp.]|jgi:hypothetical protein